MKFLNQTSKTNWKFIVFVAFVAVFLAGGILMLIPQLGDSTPSLPSSVISSPTPALSEVEGWQTYRNDEFGFEVRCPREYKVYVKGEELVYKCPTGYRASINISVTPPINSLDSYVKTYLENTSLNVHNQYPIDVSGHSAIQLEVFNETSGFPSIETFIMRDKQNIIVAIKMEDQEEPPFRDKDIVRHLQQIYDQILSTFRFVQKEGNNEQLGDAATKEECLAKGGVWQTWGLAQRQYCQIPAKDAGKSCTDRSQCTYGCISETGSIPGKCATYKNTFGCFSPVLNGKAEQALCVD